MPSEKGSFSLCSPFVQQPSYHFTFTVSLMGEVLPFSHEELPFTLDVSETVSIQKIH